MPSEPTQQQTTAQHVADELARQQVQSLSSDVRALIMRLDGLLDRMDTLYQRRDVAEAIAVNQTARVQDVVDDVKSLTRRVDQRDRDRRREQEDQAKEATAMRRLVLSALIFPVLVAVIAGLLLAVIL